MMTRIKHWLQRYYILLIVAWVFVYTWPLFNAADNTAGVVGDALYYPGYHAWFCDNFFANRFQVNDFFAPIGVNLQAGYDMPLLSTVSCVFRSMGPVFMSNIIQVLQVFLIFLSSYLLAKRFIKHPALQISFIFLYSFSSFYIVRSEAHFNILSSIWGTSLALWAFYDLDLSKFVHILRGFILLAFIFVSNWQNIPNLFIPITLILATQFSKSAAKLRSVLYLSVSVVLAVLISWPFVLPIFTAYTNNQRHIDTQSMTWFNADIITYLVPASDHWSRFIFDGLVASFESRKFPYFEALNAFDIVCLLLVGYGFWKYKDKVKHFLNKNKVLVIIALISAVSAFGPFISILGKNVLPLPYYPILAKFPPYSLTRTPARISIVALCVGYLLLMIYLDKQKVKKSKWLWGLMIYAVISTTAGSNNLQYPYLNIHQLVPENGLREIHRDKNDAYVLNVPLSLLSDPTQNFLQLFHQKKLINGYVSYAVVTNDTLSYINSHPILKSLECQPTEPNYVTFMSNMVKNPAQATALLHEANVSYLIVNNSGLSHPNCQYVASFVQTLDKYPSHYHRLDANEQFRVYKIMP